METYNTRYGLITLYQNEVYIGAEFKIGRYWDEDTLQMLKTTGTAYDSNPYLSTSKIVFKKEV